MSLVAEEFNRYSQYINYNVFKNKTFLITGAKGFLGSSTIRFLLYLNDKYSLDLFIYATTRNPNKIPDYIKEDQPIKYIPFESFEDEEYEHKINYIIHTAAPTSRLEFINHPLETFDIIVNGTRRILDFAKEHHVKSTLYLSSVEIYRICRAVYSYLH